MSDKEQTETHWESVLTPEEFQICRQKGTERAFTGEYWEEKREGIYRCRCCGEALFASEVKYDSGSGWPSFYQAVSDECIKEFRDSTQMMERVEIVCRACGCHLGHVFSDGPKPTGLRYCVNSLSIKLDSDNNNIV